MYVPFCCTMITHHSVGKPLVLDAHNLSMHIYLFIYNLVGKYGVVFMCRHAISCQTARVVLVAVFAAKDEKIKVAIIKLYNKDQILEYDPACL